MYGQNVVMNHQQAAVKFNTTGKSDDITQNTFHNYDQYVLHVSLHAVSVNKHQGFMFTISLGNI